MTTVERVVLGTVFSVVGVEEVGATTADETEDEIGTSDETAEEVATAATVDEVITGADDTEDASITADEVAGVDVEVTEAADDTEPEAAAPPGPETLRVISPLST